MFSLSAFAPENLVSRDGFGSPVPRQPAHLQTPAESGAHPPHSRLNVVLTYYGIPPHKLLLARSRANCLRVAAESRAIGELCNSFL